MNKDARSRAKKLLDEIISVGSYTHSLGIASVRINVARFIAHQDSVPEPSIENIFLTEGASQGVHILLKALIMDSNDAVMIPIPQYPLYSAALTL
ncbi:MAG: aminotransferase class I/II-fold pyridoxal phosphate-dependent enzyme, partial [Simkania sp.]|nr:aminotransferase class I/II-fold pyridoxal phosphate-dependent enzyme [Simkania sp.]